MTSPGTPAQGLVAPRATTLGHTTPRMPTGDVNPIPNFFIRAHSHTRVDVLMIPKG